jgi:hypothetical protein
MQKNYPAGFNADEEMDIARAKTKMLFLKLSGVAILANLTVLKIETFEKKSEMHQLEYCEELHRRIEEAREISHNNQVWEFTKQFRDRFDTLCKKSGYPELIYRKKE